jgi:hypothetical protein
MAMGNWKYKTRLTLESGVSSLESGVLSLESGVSSSVSAAPGSVIVEASH